MRVSGEEVRRLVRFFLVGGLSTILFLLSQYILIGLLGFGLTVATTLSFLICFFVSYFGHHSITFQREGRHERYMLRFLLATTFLVGISNLFMHYGVNVLGVTYLQASFVVAILYPILSYLAQSLWVFALRYRKS